jgi:hypothetical protein
MNKWLTSAITLGAGLALIFTTGALGSENEKLWCAGNLCLLDDGGISPSKLPRHEKAPITAHLHGEVSTRDGGHPPALKSADIEIDKTIAIDAVGLPTCGVRQIQSSTSAVAKRACGNAIIGSGTAEVEVAFPEQPPFRSTGPLVLFNGGVRGRTTTVLIHAYVNVPAPTAIVTQAKVTRIHRDRYGLQIAVEVPKIAGGSGSVTSFDLEVGRTFTYKGRKKSLLKASCPTGTWMTRGRAMFEDGTRLSIHHPFSCTPRG